MDDVGAIPPAVGETLEVVWMRSYHHNVGSHVKLPAGRARNPLTHVHVRNAKSIDVLRPSGKAILQPLKKNSIETSWVVMLGAGRWTRQASPFTGTLMENSKFAALAGGIIHDSRAVGYEVWSGPQCVRNFLSVCYRQVFSRALSARHESNEKTKYSYLHFEPREEFFAIQLPVQRCSSLKQPSPGVGASLRDLHGRPTQNQLNFSCMRLPAREWIWS